MERFTSVQTFLVGSGAISLLFLLAPQAEAQSKACVSLHASAGYVAWMGVRKGDTVAKDKHWSDEFPAGDTRCISLDQVNVKVGEEYTVLVTAAAGSQRVPCEPRNQRRQKGDHSVTHQASGTTVNVKCEMHK